MRLLAITLGLLLVASSAWSHGHGHSHNHPHSHSHEEEDYYVPETSTKRTGSIPAKTVSGDVPVTVAPASEENGQFYLKSIFNKYGYDGRMTFEGFEHLMDSLGLGRLNFDDYHDVSRHRLENSSFVDVHDSNHSHVRKDKRVTTASPVKTDQSDTRSKVHSHSDHSHSHGDHSHSDHDHAHSHAVARPKKGSTNQKQEDREGAVRDDQLPVQYSHYRSSQQEANDVIARERSGEKYCMTPSEMLSTLNIDPTQSPISPQKFLEICPAIVYELDQRHCPRRDSGAPSGPFGKLSYEDEELYGTIDVEAIKRSAIYDHNVWLWASVAVVIISLCGLGGVAVIPIMSGKFYTQLIQFLVALAIGTLTGDALLHLLPHAMSPHSHEEFPPDHNHRVRRHASEGDSSSHGGGNMNIWLGLTALCSMLFFFLAERIMHAVSECKQRHIEKKRLRRKMMMADGDGDFKGLNMIEFSKEEIGGGGLYGAECGQNDVFVTTPTMKDAQYTPMKEMSQAPPISPTKKTRKISVLDMDEHDEQIVQETQRHSACAVMIHDADVHHSHHLGGHSQQKKGHGHHHHKEGDEIPESISSVAWMVIMGDGLHNFTDGLAIGVAFASGLAGGFSTAVAVFCHELPHELGDFAVLLKSGMGPKQALYYNMVSSVLCFAGMLLGVFLGNITSFISWVFAGAAGSFIYIALVDMIPELNESSSKENLCIKIMIQVFGILSGIGIMLMIALYEHDLQTLFE